MNGVAGIFAYHTAAPPIHRAELERIGDGLTPRAPAFNGTWFSPDGRVGLAHRGAAITERSERAAQPSVAAEGTAVVAYDGVIFNLRALRHQVMHRGEEPRRESDVEVLLALYRRDGEGMFEAIRGMYACALWDARRGALLLARDPCGIKPLYLADDGWTARFASRLKALMAGGGVAHAPEPAAQAGFLMFGSVPEPLTLWRDVHLVPPGSFQWVDESGPWRPRVHTSIATEIPASSRAAQDHVDAAAARDVIAESVRSLLPTEEPAGALLSPDVDSCVMLAHAAAVADAALVTATTVAFEGSDDGAQSDLALLRRLAAECGVAHEACIVTEPDFQAALPCMVDAMDQPTVSGIDTWFMARACGQRGLKIAISGVGTHEMVAMFHRLREASGRGERRPVPSRMISGPLGAIAWRSFPSRLGDGLARLLNNRGAVAIARPRRPVLFSPAELPGILTRDVAHTGLERLRRRGVLESMHYHARATLDMTAVPLGSQALRDCDWVGAAQGIEIRAPLMDIALLRCIGPTLARLTDVAGLRFMAASTPRPLPPELIRRTSPRTATTVGRWIERSELLAGRPPVPPARGTNQWARAFAAALLERWTRS